MPNYGVSFCAYEFFCTSLLLPLPQLSWENRPAATPRAHRPLCLAFPPSIFPSADQENTTALIPATHNTGGSLPDLTNIHFPSPLPTPLDPEEPTFPALSSSSSTGNLAANLTHLGIGGAGQGKAGLGGGDTPFPDRGHRLVRMTSVFER